MKNVAVILVLFVSCIAFINSSPLPGLGDNKVAPTKSKDTKDTAVVSARQSADDDEDDDDEEDDLDIDPLEVVDDDDDDDDEDDDEEDNKPPKGVKGDEDEDDDDDDDDTDYLDRFIDDILGGDEDDDDDDDDTRPVVEPIKPASPVQAPQAPVIPAAVQSDLNAADEAAALAENSADSLQQSSGVAEGAVTYDETAEEVPDVQPEGLSAINNNEGGDIQAQPAIVHQTLYPTSVAPVSANADDDEDDDDDDEDDDDDIEALTAVDDEEEDEDDGDDEDDDDEDELGDLDIASRRARAFEPGTPGDVSAIYVSKYNKFVDNILGRINKILKTNYDPVTVKLTNPTPSNKTNKTKKKKKTTKSKTRKSKETVEATSVDSNIIESTTSAEIEKLLTTEATPLISTPSEQQTSSRGSFAKEKTKSSSSKNKKSKLRVKGTSNKNKLKQTKPKQKSRARATLYGLASLKRAGDVSVNMMSDHTTIRTKFNLGPLVLKVEKEFGRAAKKELRSATATTAEMSGKLSLRVMNGGAATLHSIRVLQPKQVRVDSPDDHDRTREFVWKRSSHIAHLVSQKLSSAARSMLRPPPTPEISFFKS